MENFNKKRKSMIKIFISLFIIALIVSIIALLMLKYEVEGEKNMPFNLSQIVIVSTAEGSHVEGENTWNLDIVQNNDIYINIAKNKNYRDTEIIKNVTISDFQIISEPQKGEIAVYRPSDSEGKKFEVLEEYEVGDKIVYEGKEKASSNNLEIANQGGVISLRYANRNLREIFF